MSKMTDDDLMPFGKYRGKKMANVPASYLIFLYENVLEAGSIKNYIEENLESLKQEANG